MQISKLVFLFILPRLCWSQSLSYALEQIEGEALISAGLNGSGVKIGIIDGGFLGANKAASLSDHFADDRVSFYKDYITPQLMAYGGSAKLRDNHGTSVWELIGGIDETTGIQLGLATKSEYYLARTDHGAKDQRDEERYLIQAMYEMIRHGVKIFNISLGYTNGYVRSEENYTPTQIDGRSTWITRSLDSLLAIHNVLVVVSAGNDGDSRWQLLSAPADSRHVLTVGATKLSQWESTSYSAKGPETLGFVKPDVSCYSASGTSFSAPVVTGLAACLMQYDSTLSPVEIKKLIVRSGHTYPHANNLMGYGVPSAKRILSELNGQSSKSVTQVMAPKNTYTLNLTYQSELLKTKATVYHKDGWNVIKKESIKAKQRIRIKRPEGASQSTILLRAKAIEVIWP